ncbi:MAG TPA: phosphohydrolase, partial [Thermoanaerobaculia bacterium]
DVTDEKYRYPGPQPQTREMGVLMIADAVEAASRTLVEGSPAKIRALIRTIVDDCLHDGQLDHTDLTLSDLRLVSESFLRVLSNIFHQRIDYPGLDFNAHPTREKKPIRLQAS